MSNKKIVCVGAPPEARAVCDELERDGWQVHHATDFRAARRLIQPQRFAVGLIFGSGLSDAQIVELDAFLESASHLEWVGCFDRASLQRPACCQLILTHLFDHHTLPLDRARLAGCLGHAHGRAALREAAEAAAEEVSVSGTAGTIVCHSAAMLEVLRQAKRVAPTSAPVLICGESGTGKEVVAQVVHRHSARSQLPFLAINCGAIQPSLIQSELFGHERGSFSGAVAEKRGYFETAEGGTVFLDEIGDLPLDLQVNLLRFLQEGTISRVGSSRVIKLDVRVIAATNVDLSKAVTEGRFRQDLLYRLNVLPLHVPPLRERWHDVKPLAEHWFSVFRAERGTKVRGFTRQAIQAMEAHDWPGNVRELINRVRCSMIMAEGKFITSVDLGLGTADADEQSGLDAARMRAEQLAIQASLLHTGRNVSNAARRLGVSRMTLYRLMDKHGISAAS